MAGHAGSRAEIAGIEHKPLTSDQLAAALLDPCVFIDRHCFIRGRGGRQERFRIVDDWQFQSEVIQCFDEEDLTLVLKARQLGISWSADAYALWLTSANQGQTVIILSQGQRESKEEMRRIRYMHKRLPPELKRRTGVEAQDAHAPDTTEHLEFPDMDSRIISLPSTEHAGTSYTATLVIIHELAKITMAASLVAAITPTMADSGRMIIVSTALGFSGTFYEYWQNNAERWHTGQVVGDRGPEGTFRPVFIPWHARPNRSQSWYEATKRTLGEKKMKQEYPACLTSETLVSTDRGIIPILEARAGDTSESGDVVAAGPQPTSVVWRLTTGHGRTLRGTGDHPVHMPSGEFVGLADLEPGQEITLRPPRFADEDDYHIVHLESIPAVTRATIIGERWGRFLGYFAGDGSVYGAGQISVVCDAQDSDVVLDVRALLCSLIGEPQSREIQHGPASSYRPNNGAIELRVQRKEALEILVAVGAAEYNSGSGSSRRNVCVPDAIFRSPQSVVREFLRGLFEADGSASEGVVRWGSSKKILAEQVQLLLLGFGINAALSRRSYNRKIGTGDRRDYDFWWLNFPAEHSLLFHDQIGFISARKRALRKVPKQMFKRNLMVDTVAEVIWDGIEETYDLTVEPDHVFSANGILTHNTPTEAFQGAADAVFSDEFERYTHVLDASRHPGSAYEVVASCDMGINHAYGHLIEVQGPTAFVFDEVHVENGTVEELGTALVTLMKHHGLDPNDTMCYPDPAGVARNPQTLQTDYDVLKECGLLVDDSGVKVSPAQRVDIIKNKLKRGHFWIGQDCPGLVDALEKAQWKMRAGPGGVKIREDTYTKDGVHEHPLDSVGYGISRVYPPNSAAAVDTEPAVAAATGSYSGSDYGG